MAQAPEFSLCRLQATQGGQSRAFARVHPEEQGGGVCDRERAPNRTIRAEQHMRHVRESRTKLVESKINPRCATRWLCEGICLSDAIRGGSTLHPATHWGIKVLLGAKL